MFQVTLKQVWYLIFHDTFFLVARRFLSLGFRSLLLFASLFTLAGLLSGRQSAPSSLGCTGPLGYV